jgi:hypothetical protein
MKHYIVVECKDNDEAERLFDGIHQACMTRDPLNEPLVLSMDKQELTRYVDGENNENN